MYRIIFFTFLFFYSNLSFSQNYDKVQHIIEENLIQFDSWMKENGIGEALRVDSSIITESGVTVLLELNIADSIAVSSWTSLKESYNASSFIKLEERLFIKCSNITGIDFEDLRIKVKSLPRENNLSSLEGLIMFDKINKKIKIRGFRPRSEVDETATIPKFMIKKELMYPDSIPINTDTNSYSIALINNNILEKARMHFTSKGADVEFRDGMLFPLTFSVRNIKNEVVPEGGFIFPNPHEKIDFIISIEIEDEFIKLNCTLDGKYGSGYWFLKPSVDNNYTDMFPKYKEELESYVSLNFQSLLISWLK